MIQALAEVTRQIRKGTYHNGLVLANGGLLTYQHALCLSSMPRKDHSDYPQGDAQPALAKSLTKPPFDEFADGEASIEVRILLDRLSEVFPANSNAV